MNVLLTVTTARAASYVHSQDTITDPNFITHYSISTEVICSKRDCLLLNLLINETTTI